MKKNRTPLIALFGPDGSGKTTVADALCERFKKMSINTIRMHWRPGFLPYRGRNLKSSKNLFTDPHLTKTRHGIKALLIFLYIVIDFIVGYYFLVLPHLRKGNIVVYERYYYDILVDQKRYGLKIPILVRDIISYVLPIPDIVVLLDARSDVLYKRKGEIEYSEIERQRMKLKHYLSQFDGFTIIDVGANSPDTVADIIIQKASLLHKIS